MVDKIVHKYCLTTMKLQDFVNPQLSMPLRYNFEAITTDKELSKQIQILLKNLDYLDSEADGKFGPISSLALKTFQLDLECAETDYLGPVTAKKLIETKPGELTER